jgi:four helix bundle protein
MIVLGSPGCIFRLSGLTKCNRLRVGLSVRKTGAGVVTQLFAHERLKVYQKGMDFATIRSELLDGLLRRVSACDHLDRGAESILVNIAHASSSWSPKDRIVSLGHANGSAFECAACLDVFVAKKLLTNHGSFPDRRRTRTVETYRSNAHNTFKGRSP